MLSSNLHFGAVWFKLDPFLLAIHIQFKVTTAPLMNFQPQNPPKSLLGFKSGDCLESRQCKAYLIEASILSLYSVSLLMRLFLL